MKNLDIWNYLYTFRGTLYFIFFYKCIDLLNINEDTTHKLLVSFLVLYTILRIYLFFNSFNKIKELPIEDILVSKLYIKFVYSKVSVLLLTYLYIWLLYYFVDNLLILRLLIIISTNYWYYQYTTKSLKLGLSFIGLNKRLINYFNIFQKKEYQISYSKIYEIGFLVEENSQKKSYKKRLEPVFSFFEKLSIVSNDKNSTPFLYFFSYEKKSEMDFERLKLEFVDFINNYFENYAPEKIKKCDYDNNIKLKAFLILPTYDINENAKSYLKTLEIEKYDLAAWCIDKYEHINDHEDYNKKRLLIIYSYIVSNILLVGTTEKLVTYVFTNINIEFLFLLDPTIMYIIYLIPIYFTTISTKTDKKDALRVTIVGVIVTIIILLYANYTAMSDVKFFALLMYVFLMTLYLMPLKLLVSTKELFKYIKF